MNERGIISPELVARAVMHLAGPELAKKSFRHFVRQSMPEYQEARHHRLIMQALQLVEMGLIKRLAISMPPRHGKSELVSIRYPAWYLGRHPTHNVIHASYGSDLSNDFSRRVRALVRDDPVFRSLFPAVELDEERARINDWRLANGGGFRSVGTGGGVTGHGGHLIIIDDPHKEGDASSPAALREAWDWYTSAVWTRQAPGAAIVVTATRWAPLDLIGHLIRAADSSPKADQWWVLVLPGLAEENDPLGRAPGEALWPEWFPAETLLAMKAISEPFFLALYQQDPRAMSSVMFRADDFRRAEFVDVGASETSAFCFDLALGDNEGGDYTCYARATYNRATGVLGFDHLYRELIEWPLMKEGIRELMRLHPDADFVFPKHTYELMAIQELRYEVPGMASHLKQVSFPAGSDKRARAQCLSWRASQHRVVVEDCPVTEVWLQDYEDFPTGDHDDPVDVGSVAAHHFGIQGEFAAAIVDADARARQRVAEAVKVQAALERIGYA